MKILVFSDTHLGSKFYLPKLNFLMRLIKSVDRVIINGDFWEASQSCFDQFIHSRWNTLFPLLKQRRAIYIAGNHDPKKSSNTQVKLFASQVLDSYQFKHKLGTIYLEHGHQTLPGFERLNCLPNKKLLQLASGKVVNTIENWGIKHFGAKFSQLFFTRSIENKILEYRLSKKHPNKIIITSHTHQALISNNQRYYNSGFINHGLANYILITDDNIELKQARY